MAKKRKSQKKDLQKKLKQRRKVAPATRAGRPARRAEQAFDLIERGRWTEALAILEALHQQGAAHEDVLRGLAECYHELGRTADYQRVCREMLERNPHDPFLHLAVAEADLINYFPAAAYRRFREFLKRWPDHPEAKRVRDRVAEIPEVVVASIPRLEGMSDEEALEIQALNDETTIQMHLGHPDKAARSAEEILRRYPKYVPAHNNLTQIRLLQGRPDEAQRHARQALEIEPENHHALANLAHCLLMQGELDEAQRYGERLRQTSPPRDDQWVKKAETFTFLGQDAWVLETLEDRKKNGPPGEIPIDALLYHYAAAAALRLGRKPEAKRYWTKALQLDPALDRAAENLKDLDRPVEERHAPWALSLREWTGERDVQQLRTRIEKAGKRGADGAAGQAVREFLEQNPGVRKLIPMILERGDPAGRELAMRLAIWADTPEMREALKAFALGPWGPDRLRFDAAHHLTQAGALPDGPTPMWVRGKKTEIMLVSFEIYEEPDESRYPPHVEQLAIRGMDALHEDEAGEAERFFREALKHFPNDRSLVNNLIAAIRAQDREKEADQMLRENFRKHPDYFFARTEMARLYLREGKLDQAKELLDAVWPAKRLHYTEFRALVATQLEYHWAKRDLAAGRNWLQLWRSYVPDDPTFDFWETRLFPSKLDALLPRKK